MKIILGVAEDGYNQFAQVGERIFVSELFEVVDNRPNKVETAAKKRGRPPKVKANGKAAEPEAQTVSTDS